MVDFKRIRPTARQQIGIGAAVLLAVGVAGGAGAVELTRPAIEMAPVQPVAIASLPQRSGVVTVKGKVAEVYGDRFTLADGSGKAMVDAGRDGRALVTPGAPVLVQGRYDDGQLRASYVVDRQGDVQPIGPAGGPPPPPPPGGRAGPGAPPPPPPGRGGPRGGPGAPPPPPPGCGIGPAGGPPPPPPPPPVGADGQPVPPPAIGAAGQPPMPLPANGTAPTPN